MENRKPSAPSLQNLEGKTGPLFGPVYIHIDVITYGRVSRKQKIVEARNEHCRAAAWKWSPWKGTPSHSNTNSQRATECESFSPAPVTTFCGCKFQIINSKLVTEELLNLFGSRILAALKAETRIDPLISDLIIGAENNVWALALWQSLGKGR